MMSQGVSKEKDDAFDCVGREKGLTSFVQACQRRPALIFLLSIMHLSALSVYLRANLAATLKWLCKRQVCVSNLTGFCTYPEFIPRSQGQRINKQVATPGVRQRLLHFTAISRLSSSFGFTRE